ncbi:MAG: hypothetical protein LJD31_04200 [Wolbachia endosymbiont of Menacanthus eurysternus]|nr:hypothetical protein [Wolbachia endosymbiont of Menacanthus eurysternus]
MPGSFAFYKDSRKTAAETDLSDAKVMIYKDGGENEYILDASGVAGLNKIDDLKLSNLKDIKIKYQPKDSSDVEEVEGLGNIIGKLFATKSASTANSKTILEEEVAKSSVAGAVLGATESTSDGKTKSILVEKLGEFLDGQGEVYGTAGDETASDFLADKYPLAKTDASNLNGNHKKAFAEAILGVEYTDSDSKKRSVLVEKLGKSLGDNTDDYKAKYDGSNEQTAIDFLKSKGLEPASASEVATQLLDTTNKNNLGEAILGVKKDGTPVLETDLAANENFQTAVAAVPALKTAVAADAGLRNAVKNALASDTTFQGNVKITVNSNEPGFQGSVREVMSKPVFEIPADDNAPLSWDW